MTAVPAWFLALLGAGHVPAERCVDDCVILAHAFAELGVVSQVRVAELTVSDPVTGMGRIFGVCRPEWRNGLLDGHTALWLPDAGHLVDTTAGQYPPVAAAHPGPVVTQVLHSPAQDRPAGNGQAAFSVTVPLPAVDLHYALAPLSASSAVLDHPLMTQEAGGHRRRGSNVAALTVSLLADHLPAARSRDIPHPRVAALVDAVRSLPRHQTSDGDWRFEVLTSEGTARACSLAEVPVPHGTPAAVTWP